MGHGGAAVEAALREKIVDVDALFVFLEYLDLGLGNTQDHLQLAQLRLIFSVEEEFRIFRPDRYKHVHDFFLSLHTVGAGTRVSAHV